MTSSGVGTTGRRLGRYHLAEPLGGGPTGEVFRAKVYGVAGFEREFAVKRFHSAFVRDPEISAALAAAARSYSSLEHPRIARLHEYGVAGGESFTATELVRGIDAARLMSMLPTAEQPLSPGAAVALVSQAARAVGYAHGRGICHLGLCATNLLATPDGDVKLTDFCFLPVRLPDRPGEDPTLRVRLPYLAPEQLVGEPASAATDVYQLGVLAYELLTGRAPFGGSSSPQIAQQVLSSSPRVPDLPEQVREVVMRCLARSPLERYPDARTLADALDAGARAARLDGDHRDLAVLVRELLGRLEDVNDGNSSGTVNFPMPSPPMATPGPPARAPSVPEPPRVGPRGQSPAAAAPTAEPGASFDTLLPLDDADGASQELKYLEEDAPTILRNRDQEGKTPPPRIDSAQGTAAGLAPAIGVSPAARPARPNSTPPSRPGTGAGGQRPGGMPRAATPPPRPPGAPAGRGGRAPSAPPTQRPRSVPPGQPMAEAAHGEAGRTVLGLATGDLVAPGNRSAEAQRPATAPPLPPGAEQQSTLRGNRPPAAAGKRSSVRRSAVAGDYGEQTTQAGPLAAANAAEQARRSGSESAQAPPSVPGAGNAPGAPLAGAGAADLGDPDATAQLDADAVAPPPAVATHASRGEHMPLPSPPKSEIMPAAVASAELEAALAAEQPVAEPLNPLLDARDGEFREESVGTALHTRPRSPWLAVAAVLAAAVLGGGGYLAYRALAADGGDEAPVASAEDEIDAGAAAGSAVAQAPEPEEPEEPEVEAREVVGGEVSAAPGDDGKLSLTSKPEDAKVYLDGSLQGRTPLTLDATADRHRLALVLPGHRLFLADIDGSGSYEVTLEEVTPSGGEGGIKVRCRKKNRYYVFLDGKDVGQLCPTERLGVPLGEHVVEIYDPETETRAEFQVDVEQTRRSTRVRVD